VTAPYRNELDALRERKQSLEQEIARLREQTQNLEGLRRAERELRGELANIDGKLGARRVLPMLDALKVASPCSAKWEDMVGDDRVRFCGSCAKNVFNLSAMPRAEAESLLRERMGGELCVRFYQRADGTVMTTDCPVGAKKKQRKKLALAVAGAGAMAAAAFAYEERRSCVMGDVAMTGAVAVHPQIDPPAPEADPQPMMGTPAPLPPPEPPPRQTVGRMPLKR
jgi:hypothetical protein